MEKLQKLPRQELRSSESVIMENKKYKEAAEELHISVNTLKTHLTRALRQLRKEYNLHSLFTKNISFPVTHLLIWALLQ